MKIPKCSAPFVGLSLLNISRPCCQYNQLKHEAVPVLDSKPTVFYLEKRKSLQKDFNTKMSESCQTCVMQQNTYADFFNQRWAPSKRMKKADAYDLKMLHVQFNNKCNLACRMCSPGYSSLHAKELYNDDRIRHWIKPNSLLFHTLVTKIPEIEYLYLTGGESLLDPTTWQFIDHCIALQCAKNITLQINTNGTVKLKPEQVKKLNMFKSLILHISVDGVESMAEYTRTGLVWNSWIKNLDRYIEKFDKSEITIVNTISSMNIWEMDKIKDFYINEKELYYHQQVLSGPDGLAISNLNDTAKQYLIDKYSGNSDWSSVIDFLKLPRDKNIDVVSFFEMQDNRAIKSGLYNNYKTYAERFPEYWKLISTT